MTVNEIRDFLAKYTANGMGETDVLVCHQDENPFKDTFEIVGGLFIETDTNAHGIVLQIE